MPGIIEEDLMDPNTLDRIINILNDTTTTIVVYLVIKNDGIGKKAFLEAKTFVNRDYNSKCHVLWIKSTNQIPGFLKNDIISPNIYSLSLSGKRKIGKKLNQVECCNSGYIDESIANALAIN